MGRPLNVLLDAFKVIARRGLLPVSWTAGYGIIKGGEMALATYDPAAYCAYGAELRKEFQT
ncbi:hypothetical protein [Rhodovulum euryhalinum]|uniref:hypothetical protein n=1 Tax=Rhodovulum euryhalinum TaxID=35805 RepID=UPI0010464596|nr:hypothetical protein [Rhodovulum euryhalinum]